MPLDDNEWDLVTCLVADHLLGSADPYGELKTYFPNEVAAWPTSPVPAKYAATVIRFAKMTPLSEPQPLPLRLLETLLRIAAVQVSPDVTKLRAFRDRLLQEKAALAAADPFGAMILPGTGEVFIDRAPSRALLASLVAANTMPEPVALRVVGEAKSGKSYTFSFILHLSAPRGIVPVRLMLSRSSTAEDILRDLSIHLAERDEKPDPVTDPVKRLRHWAQWIVRQAARADPPRTWWFVFDQCNELDRNSDAVELIAQLAVAIREMTVAGVPRPRLVLLGYGDEFADLQLPRRQIYLDRVARVGDGELRDFFTCVFRQIDADRGVPPTTDTAVLAELVDVAVQQVLQEAQLAAGAGIPYMKALGLAVEDAVDEYAN